MSSSGILDGILSSGDITIIASKIGTVFLVVLVYAFAYLHGYLYPSYKEWSVKQKRLVLLAFLFSLSGWSFAFTALALYGNEKHYGGYAIGVLIFSIISWTATLHFAAFLFDGKISEIRAGFATPMFRNWTKSIDYIYIVISAISIVRIAASSIYNNTALVDVFSVVLLGFATALRLTKSSAEIFGWDKKSIW